MDEFENLNELNNNFNNLNADFNDLSSTLGLDGNTSNSSSSSSSSSNCDTAFNNGVQAGQVDALCELKCITKQYQSLVILLIILYSWSNQCTTNYLMNTNNQLICNLSCLLDKLVDNAVENCANCKNCGNVSPAQDTNRKPKHRHKHRDCRNDCDCDCDCDCDEC
ncbi:hypothetical protein CLOBY_25760 [Clostridium saccharobutylicum]|uniref:hypothetical protein n=1 Tax=Clostridium saccharobutylicum TaxID=169679 RepID=UPI000983A1BC|nr:hypothetical protein [Clostridium saccharobutylicum]AQS10433.1 hypothetical protein CLOBY_25760 [Clostridium saccharobutylicum]MBC2437852.1 hypothetical protein [Clostridium saccharobutylicum]NSB90279.1 hypothetical protein [Clostridium saccharobutylicum]NYC31379.1 hypothetical protein [Clostridium saccharobutylicum]OOM16785.1 hypothetical protein CLSAB_23200 [Clostridium saccharobutylicum]